MKKGKVLSLILSGLMVLAMAPTASFAAEYSDTAGYWAKDEISKWSDLGIIQGSNGNFRPADQITRGDLAVILDRVMNYQEKSSDSFSDLGDRYYTDAILKANKAGVILGSNGQVRPQDSITREEAAVMFARALSLKEISGNSSFTDNASISSWALGYVNAVKKEGIMAGRGDNSFSPKDKITRGEIVKLLDNSIKGLYTESGEFSTDVAGNAVINAAGVTLKNMTIVGDLIVAEGVGEGEVHLDNVKIKGDTIVRGGGEHSVYFANVDVEGALIVNKVGGNLRIVATGTTKVSLVTLESGAIIVTKELTTGEITKVEIPAEIASGQKVVLTGNFKSVENNAAGISVESTGKIDKLVLNEKATFTGGGEIASVTVATGADSVVNGKAVAGGSSSGTTGTTGTSSGGSSGGSGGSGTSTFTVSFNTNGGNSISSVSVNSGNKVALPADPTKSGYSFLGWYTDSALQNAFNSNTAITANTTLYAKWSGWQSPTEVDSRFAAGYPQATIVSSGGMNVIQLEVKVTGATAANPMDVFMTVNQDNAGSNVNTESVLHGHAGTGGDLIDVSETPYIRITDGAIHTITTNVEITGTDDVDVCFVLKQGSTTSAVPTMLNFDQIAVNELDTYAPYCYHAYINSAMDKIFLYFDENLDVNAVPTNSAFTISGGAGTPVIDGVSISNTDDVDYGIVTLSVSGITDITGLKIDYTKPASDPLQDQAVSPNAVQDFTDQAVDSAVPTVTDMDVSGNGQYVHVAVDHSYFFADSENDWLLTLKYGTDSDSASAVNASDYDLGYSYACDGTWVDIYFVLGSAPTLDPGKKYFVDIDSNGLKDYAGDAIAALSANGAPQNEGNSVTISAVTYDSAGHTLTIDFDGDPGLTSNGYCCLFTLKAADGTEYTLRGNTFLDFDNVHGKSSIVLDESAFPFDADEFNWTGAQIKYSLDNHPSANSYEVFSFPSGMPYSGFDYITIT